MATKNDITNDQIKSKPTSDLYRENYDKIFKKPCDWHVENIDNGNDFVVKYDNSKE